MIVFLSKESAIIYAAGLGLYAFCFVSGMRRVGFSVAALSLPAFFFVVSVLQPALLEGGPQGMIHLARFKDFGASVPEALANMMAFPTKAK